MNVGTIVDSIVTILNDDPTLVSYSREITSNFVETPYLKGTYIIIEVLSGNVSTHEIQPFGCNRYYLPIIINIHQRKIKMSDSEDELELVTNRLMSVLDNNRKKITGVNGITDIILEKDLESDNVESRLNSFELTLDIIEER